MNELNNIFKWLEKKKRKRLQNFYAKPIKKDSVVFCKEHRDWICVECCLLHKNHIDKPIKGTNEHIFKKLKKNSKSYR